MNDSSNLGSEKYWAIKRFLEEEYLLVHINTTADGLSIPEHLTKDSSVTLKISQYFRGAMNVSPTEITADLLFSGNYETCVIPLDAIWGCHSERGNTSLWPDSAPSDVLQTILASAITDKESSDAKKEEGSKPLSAVSQVEEDSGDSDDEDSDDTQKKLPRKGHLRRVK